MEFVLTGKDGRRRWFEARGQPIRTTDAGIQRGGVVAIRDITERTRQRRLQMEFVALVSHELRTPLTSLSTYLQLLNKQFVDEPDDSRTRIFIERSQHQVQQIQHMVQDMLDLQRLQSSSFHVEQGRGALDQLVAYTVEMAQAMTTNHTIRLERPTAPMFVEGDAARLEQTLLNLLTNAITYAPHSKYIDVRLRRIGSEAELQVQDYGTMGIPAAELPNIFSRFYQVVRNDSDRPSRRGLGLGLYISNQLIVAHRGRIEVMSVEGTNEGHGTTFTIYLPLAPDESGEIDDLPQQ